MKIIKVRKDHICEKCGGSIPNGTIATTDKLLDNTKSFGGCEYFGYFHPHCYDEVFNKPRGEVDDTRRSIQKI